MGLCMVILHPPGAACWLCLHPVSVCLHCRGTSLLPKLQADNIFSVFCPKSAVRDLGNLPSPNLGKAPHSLAAKRLVSTSCRWSREGGREQSRLAPSSRLPALLGRPRGSGARSCIKELVPKPAFPNRSVSAPAVFHRRKWCF